MKFDCKLSAGKGIATVLIMFFSFMVLPATLWATTYYVSSSSGNDGNPGTYEAPWKTIKKALMTHFQPGDELLLKRGDTWYERLWLKQSGTEDSPIVIAAYGDQADPRPVLNGTYPEGIGPYKVIKWEQVGGPDSQIYRARIGDWWSNIRPPGLLIYNGLPKPAIATMGFSESVDRVKPGAVLLQSSSHYCSFLVLSVDTVNNRLSGITNYRSDDHWQPGKVEVRQEENNVQAKFFLNMVTGLTVEQNSLQEPGQWYWDDAEQAIYLYSGYIPTKFSVQIPYLDLGLILQGPNNMHDIVVRALRIEGYLEVGIKLADCYNVRLEDMHILYIGPNNEGSGVLFNTSSNCSLIGSTVESVMRKGVNFFVQDITKQCSENTVSNNTIRYTGNAGIMLSTDTPQKKTAMQNNIIENNIIDHSGVVAYDTGGVYLQNSAYNTIRHNTITNGGDKYLQCNGIHIDTGTEGIAAIGNIIENNSSHGIGITNDGLATITENTIKYNGTSYWDSAQITFFPAFGNPVGCVVRDNILVAGEGQNLISCTYVPSVGSTDPQDFDSNSYFTCKINAFHWSNGWQVPWDMTDFHSWQILVNDDKNSTLTELPLPDYDLDNDVDGSDLAAHLLDGNFTDPHDGSIGWRIFIEMFAREFGEYIQ